MKTAGIYGLLNAVNGKWYIGQTRDMKHRKRDHLSYLVRGANPNEHLQAAFHKYGESSFSFHVLELVSDDMLDLRERTWIARYKSMDRRFGYNKESGGNRHKERSEETLRKLSISLTGRRLTKECRVKIGVKSKERNAGAILRRYCGGRKGLHNTEEHNRKISNALTGRRLSEEHCRNLSESHKNPSDEIRRGISERNRARGSPSTETRLKLREAMLLYYARKHDSKTEIETTTP